MNTTLRQLTHAARRGLRRIGRAMRDAAFSAARPLWRRGARLYRRYGPVVAERLQQYALLIRLHRPIGTMLLLWPVLWALWLAAGGLPDLNTLLIFIMGVFLMRSAGCAINDYADRRIDPHVRRTRERPLATGRVSPGEALGVFAALALIAFILVLQLNALTVYLSFAAAASTAVYPFLKRYTYLPQAFLGVAFAWGVPMAWAALTGATPQICWLLFLVVVLWVAAYDTIYAMVDREDDIKIGVKSTAILFGDADKLIIGVIQVATLSGLALLGGQANLQWPYYLGLAVAAGYMAYQQYLIRNRDPAACFAAFLSNNQLGAVVFAGIALSDLV